MCNKTGFIALKLLNSILSFKTHPYNTSPEQNKLCYDCKSSCILALNSLRSCISNRKIVIQGSGRFCKPLLMLLNNMWVAEAKLLRTV